MFTIGEIAKQFQLSRSTLLYYDAIGLLLPSDRSPANYRLYTPADVTRMKKIMLYRDAGLPLDTIKDILALDQDDIGNVLEDRLFQINEEITHLRSQQSVILKLLENEELWQQSKVLTKERWVSLMIAAGLDENGMILWHMEFESMSPKAHQDFLESLGMQDEEIIAIRNLKFQEHAS